MKNLVSRFVKDESGATAIEYGLIAAGIAIAIITAVNGVGTKLADQLQHHLDLAQVSVARSCVKGPGYAGAFIVLAAVDIMRQCPARMLHASLRVTRRMRSPESAVLRSFTYRQ